MCAQYHSRLHSLQKITRSRTKNLIHLEIQLLGPLPQYFYDDFQLYNLLYPVYSVSSKLPVQRFLLLCILSVLPHRGFPTNKDKSFPQKASSLPRVLQIAHPPYVDLTKVCFA